ncbi:hypothetical protein GCM10009753_05000 [Streptantibioticus ferralitis]
MSVITVGLQKVLGRPAEVTREAPAGRPEPSEDDTVQRELAEAETADWVRLARIRWRPETLARRQAVARCSPDDPGSGGKARTSPRAGWLPGSTERLRTRS